MSAPVLSLSWSPRLVGLLSLLLVLTGVACLLVGAASPGLWPVPAADAGTGPVAVEATRLHAARDRVDRRPNIVVVTSDDQRLDDLRWMPHTRALLAGHGIQFTQALSPHPLCCPARAELLTGQYGHNNGVQHNTGTRGGYRALVEPDNHLGRWLQEAGYQTAMVGKFLNGYRPGPGAGAGWTHWNPTVGGVYSYFDTTFYNDGRPVSTRGTHVDDALVDFAVDYIEEFAANPSPFFVWASGLAPHGSMVDGQAGPPFGAIRHAGTMSQTPVPALESPAFARPVLAGAAPVAPVGALKGITEQHVARVESLQALDEGVREIVATLRRAGELDNTYIVFTSDNGYLLGEHGLKAKNWIFEEALRVPLLVRTPAGRVRSSPVPVTWVDLAPTIVDLAQARPGRRMDGASFARLLATGRQPWRDTQLVQTGSASAAGPQPGWETRGVRTRRWTYGVNPATGAEQLYDRLRDPHQLVNLAASRPHRRVVADLAARTRLLMGCWGRRCDRSFGPVPEPSAQAESDVLALLERAQALPVLPVPGLPGVLDARTPRR